MSAPVSDPQRPATAADRGRAEEGVRRLLRIPAERPPVSGAAAERAFTASLAVSAARCMLTYVVLPFVAPAVGLAAGVGPILGIPLSGVAIGANVVSVRRFWLADHRWRWPFSALAVGVIALLAVLVVGDVAELLR